MELYLAYRFRTRQEFKITLAWAYVLSHLKPCDVHWRECAEKRPEYVPEEHWGRVAWKYMCLPGAATKFCVQTRDADSYQDGPTHRTIVIVQQMSLFCDNQHRIHEWQQVIKFVFFQVFSALYLHPQKSQRLHTKSRNTVIGLHCVRTQIKMQIY